MIKPTLFAALGGIYLLVNTSVSLAVEALTSTEIKHAEALRDTALKSPLAFDILESLTSEVGPRMAGTNKDAEAVKWGVNKLKALKFDRVWTEPVTFDRWVRGEETAAVIAPYRQPLKITALGGSVNTPDKGLTAEVAGFATLQALIDARPEDVKGKIVFINHRMSRHKDGRGYGPVVKGRGAGAVEGAKKGAVAVLIRSVGTDTHRLPHTGMMRYAEGVEKIPAAALSNPDADLLQRILDRKNAVRVKLEIGSRPDGRYTSHNVIGEITGSETPEEVVVVGGHLDSWDLGTGAVDDGAGVALTMAAAKLIADSGNRPRRTIRVILFANEEQGLNGAIEYAKVHQTDLTQHITGAESDFGAGQIYSFSSNVKQEAIPFVRQLGRVLKPLGIDYVDNKAGPGPDLIPLFRSGMSVFRLAQDGTDYFDLHHTADDTLDKVNPAALAQNAAAYAVFAYMTAQYSGRLDKPSQEVKDEH